MRLTCAYCVSTVRLPLCAHCSECMQHTVHSSLPGTRLCDVPDAYRAPIVRVLRSMQAAYTVTYLAGGCAMSWGVVRLSPHWVEHDEAVLPPVHVVVAVGVTVTFVPTPALLSICGTRKERHTERKPSIHTSAISRYDMMIFSQYELVFRKPIPRSQIIH